MERMSYILSNGDFRARTSENALNRTRLIKFLKIVNHVKLMRLREEILLRAYDLTLKILIFALGLTAMSANLPVPLPILPTNLVAPPGISEWCVK
jgi:hypothetical protein